VTISNPYFLFAFTHRLSNETITSILTDVSTHKERYNEFSVSEGNTFTLDAGEWQYVVYAQTSSTNTNPLFADEQVESGVLKVQFDVIRNSYEVTLNEKIYEIENPIFIQFLMLESGDYMYLEDESKILL
jgi:hypothetical protein